MSDIRTRYVFGNQATISLSPAGTFKGVRLDPNSKARTENMRLVQLPPFMPATSPVGRRTISEDPLFR